MENKPLDIPTEQQTDFKTQLTCKFSKVFIEIVQSCYNLVLLHLPCRTVMRKKKTVNTSWNSHFSNSLTNRPFLKSLKSPKIESIKGKSHNFAAFSCCFSTPSGPSPRPPPPSPRKDRKLITQQKIITAVQVVSFRGCLNGKILIRCCSPGSDGGEQLGSVPHDIQTQMKSYCSSV